VPSPIPQPVTGSLTRAAIFLVVTMNDGSEDAVRGLCADMAADGEELQIVRANMPFGEVGKGEFGTYFCGYARSPRRIELMLENMFVGKPPGNYDRLLDFSRAVTGTLFFVPTATFLEDVGAAAPPATDAAPPEGLGEPGADSQPAAPEGSLGIGSLRK
jgi:putative iron-dependent peroxidase